MLNKLQSKREEGFTIIEVLIVLAIAGLIMLIVFLAVPSLQRNQRNSQRDSDASRVATSVNNWVANNGGQEFTAGTNNANLTAVINDVGTLGQYTLSVGTGGTFSAATGAQSAIANTTDIRVVTRAVCGDNGATTADANRRKAAVQYGVEGGNATVGKCINI